MRAKSGAAYALLHQHVLLGSDKSRSWVLRLLPSTAGAAVHHRLLAITHVGSPCLRCLAHPVSSGSCLRPHPTPAQSRHMNRWPAAAGQLGASSSQRWSLCARAALTRAAPGCAHHMPSPAANIGWIQQLGRKYTSLLCFRHFTCSSRWLSTRAVVRQSAFKNA